MNWFSKVTQQNKTKKNWAREERVRGCQMWALKPESRCCWEEIFWQFVLGGRSWNIVTICSRRQKLCSLFRNVMTPACHCHLPPRQPGYKIVIHHANQITIIKVNEYVASLLPFNLWGLLCDLKTYQKQKQTIKALLLKTRQAIRGRS